MYEFMNGKQKTYTFNVSENIALYIFRKKYYILCFRKYSILCFRTYNREIKVAIRSSTG